MIWPVTIISGLAGLIVASIPGALLGAVLGSIVDRNLALKNWSQLRARLQRPTTTLFDQQQTLFMLLGYLAKNTGKVSAEHIQQARIEIQRAQLLGAAQVAAINAFAQGKTLSLEKLRSSLQAHYRAPEQIEQLLLAGWRMALAVGLATVKQRNTLLQCAQWLGCSEATFTRLEQQVKPLLSSSGAYLLQDEFTAALQLLGVSRTDSLADIKTAYRRQLSMHHPDKLIGSGAASAQVHAATEKTRALHNAYALLRKHQ